MANGEKDNQEETYRHTQSVQVRPCWTVATCTQGWLQQFLRGKNWCKKLIWIMTNLTRDMSRWGLYADCMICDQLTPDGDCSENNLKKWMETKKRRKLLTTTWRPSKKFSPMMTMVCPPDVQPSDGERALTWGKKMKTWKKCKIKKTIYVSCEKVVRGNAMHRQSPSHFLREVGNLPRNCTV